MMTKRHFIFLYSFLAPFLGSTVCTSASPSNNAPHSWQLVDAFEFDGEDLSSKFYNDWSIDDEPENLCVGENIYQYSCHRLRNIRLRDGALELHVDVNARRGNSRFLFNSAKIVSQKSWLYGRFVLRARLPAGKLLRAIAVMRPAAPKYGNKSKSSNFSSPNAHRTSWLDNGQINALVYAQQADAIIGGMHYRMPNGHSYVGRKWHTNRNVTNEFHRYTIEWTNHSIRWLFDDTIVFENSVGEPFDQRFNVALQIGVGGPEFDTRNIDVRVEDAFGWADSRFVIDYIRVYQPRSSSDYVVDHQKSKFDNVFLSFLSQPFLSISSSSTSSTMTTHRCIYAISLFSSITLFLTILSQRYGF